MTFAWPVEDVIERAAEFAFFILFGVGGFFGLAYSMMKAQRKNDEINREVEERSGKQNRLKKIILDVLSPSDVVRNARSITKHLRRCLLSKRTKAIIRIL